jgi:hypothetical protein
MASESLRCYLRHECVDVHAVNLLEPARQRCDEVATAAPDVQRAPSSTRQVSKQPAVEVIVVAPRVPSVECSQPTGQTPLGPVGRVIGHPCNVVKPKRNSGRERW